MPSLTLLLDDSNVIGKGIIRIVIHLANMINYMAAGYETRFGMNDSIGGALFSAELDSPFLC